VDARLRGLPSVDRILRAPEVAAILDGRSREPVVRAVQAVLDECRAEIREGGTVPDEHGVAIRAVQRVRSLERQWPVQVLNGSGVILNTNLGRAPLSDSAVAAVAAAANYVDLEVGLESGRRESRLDHVSAQLRALTGAQAAHVTGNNAGAVMLVLAALARGKDVIVSRGQAVEIGGGFRIPQILRQSGARLVEVGTANRTRLSDYEDAISPKTGALLHVHLSNFRMVGFTENVPISALGELARDRGISLIDDNGSGPLLDTERFGMAHEPTPVDSLRAGAHVVCFSGDKLLGGPQSGIVIGDSDLLQRVASQPLARALRPDKLSLAALSATLLAYLRDEATGTIPVWQMIARPIEDIQRAAALFQSRAAECGLTVELIDGESTVGGGSLPGEVLATVLVRLPPQISPSALRRASPPIFARAQGKRALLDLRTIRPEEEESLLEAVMSVIDSAAS
jgi:L-seryl-tRNA(Ser) seleniumtransferase